MRLWEIITESPKRGEFSMKLSSSESADYQNSESETSNSADETRKRFHKIADRYGVNMVDDYDDYVKSKNKKTDGEVSSLTQRPDR